MLSRFSSFLCGGLLCAALAPGVSAQVQVQPKEPETYGISFKCGNGFTEAMPRLIADLKSRDDKVRANVISILERFAIRNTDEAKKAAPALAEAAVNFRGHADALRVLAKLDEEHTLKALRRLLVRGVGRCRCGFTFNEVVASAGEPIVPHLIMLLNEPNIGANAEETLVRIGEPAVPYLVKTFDGRCRVIANPTVIRTLTRMGPKAKSAAPALERQMLIRSGTINVRIAQSLYTVSGSHQAAFDVIHNALRSDDRAQRLEALQCLNEMRPKAKELIPTVLPFLVSDDAAFPHHAQMILIAIGADAAPALIEKLGENNVKHQNIIMATLRSIGPGASAAVPAFITILNGNDKALATLAASSFPSFGPAAKSAIPHLLNALKSGDVNHRLVCAQAVAQIEPAKIGAAMPTLMEVIQAKQTPRGQLNSAVSLLTAIGPPARDAVPALQDLLKASFKKNQRQVNTYSVAQCLKSIGAVADTMPILVAALNSDNADERENALDVVENALGLGALSSLETALANGQLRESRQVTTLLKDLRQRAQANP